MWKRAHRVCAVRGVNYHHHTCTISKDDKCKDGVPPCKPPMEDLFLSMPQHLVLWIGWLRLTPQWLGQKRKDHCYPANQAIQQDHKDTIKRLRQELTVSQAPTKVTTRINNENVLADNRGGNVFLRGRQEHAMLWMSLLLVGDTDCHLCSSAAALKGLMAFVFGHGGPF